MTSSCKARADRYPLVQCPGAVPCDRTPRSAMAQGDLRLAAPNQQVRVVLELTTLDRVFAYYPTVEDALTDF